MDPRVERHAEIIVEHCIEVEAGEMVQISATQCTDDLVVALYEQLGDIGARPTLLWRNMRALRAYGRAIDPEDIHTPEHVVASMEEADAFIAIGGHRNTAESSDIPSAATQAGARARRPISEARPDRWVYTMYPATGNAQKAGMSTAAYQDFVWDAVDKDWETQREFQDQLVDILDTAAEVRIRSGEQTDLSMRVAGMDAINDAGESNLPGGEVFTAPIPESVEGTVHFDKPVLRHGREIHGAYLEFEDGEVVDHTAEQNEELLTSLLETDDGARRLGELGIGMNRDINQFTYNMLFDEKMGDTVHLALGRAIDECVPDSLEANDSAIHLDMLVDMSEDSVIEMDGEVVQRDGMFVFEEDFE